MTPWTKWLEGAPGNILSKAGGVYTTDSFREPTNFSRFAEEFAAVEPPVVDEAEKENLRDSATPLVEIISMFATKQLALDVERASKAANEMRENASTSGLEMYNIVSTAYGLRTRTEDRATSTWLEETRAGLKTGSLKLTSTMLEKLALEGVHSEEMSVGKLGEISFKGNREIRTVGEFFTVLVRWARRVLAAGTIVVGEDGCGPGAATELAEQKKALKAEISAHNRTKNELAQKTARIARPAAQRTTQKRERSPDRRRSGDHDHYSRTRQN